VLLTYRSDLGGSGTHGLIKYRVGIVDDQQRSARGAANGSGAEALHVRIRLGHPELGGPDRQLSHDVVPISDAVQHDSVECRLVEGDGRACAVHPEFGLDARHIASHSDICSLALLTHSLGLAYRSRKGQQSLGHGSWEIR
jgi:hypothetical protein